MAITNDEINGSKRGGTQTPGAASQQKDSTLAYDSSLHPVPGVKYEGAVRMILSRFQTR